MPFAIWQPGQDLTEEALNLADMIGAVVFFTTRDTNQAVTTGGVDVANAVSWETVHLDLLTGWDAGEPTRWTVPQDGWWNLAGGVGFSGSSAGTVRDCAWFVNGSLVAWGRSRPHASTALSSDFLTAEARQLPVQLSAGDYIELVPSQDTGGNLNTATGSARPFMSVTYAGPP